MNLSFVEKGFYADVVGPCSHNHEDSCGDYARRVAAGSLETVADLRAENARLQSELKTARACDRERNDARQETVEARGQLDVEIAKRVEAIDRWDTSFREMEGLAKQVLAERNEARGERDDARVRFDDFLEEHSARTRVLAALPAIIFGVVYYDLGEHGQTWERCVDKWKKHWAPALAEAHSGDCTDECHACARCQAEDVMKMVDIVRKGLEDERG